MAPTNSLYLLQYEMNPLSTSAISFPAKILEKNFSWLYIHTGVYITMGHFGDKNIVL